MRHIFYLLLGLIILNTSTLVAQDACACCTDFHTQFDFWIGDWNVYDTLGNQIGENKIEKLEDGCMLKESWDGSKGSTGSSFNYFDKTDSTWNQLWISNVGNNLILKGRLETKNKMVLKSDPDQKWNQDEISWFLNDDGSVTQLWQRIDRGTQIRKTIFKGIYRKK